MGLMTVSLLGEQTTEVSAVPERPSPLLHARMEGLDIIRGLAIFLVVCYHGFATGLPLSDQHLSHGARLLQLLTANWWLGVNLFFVLSGFLITGILLDTKQHSHYFRNFYTRRFLRIVPAYILVIALAKIDLRLHWLYVAMCVLYVANLDTFFDGLGPTYGPFWSLAVEEQFYLLWPLAVRRLSKKALLTVCVAVIVCCPVLRALSHTRFPWLGNPRFTTWMVCDNLAWGCLLAQALRSRWATLLRVQAAGLALALTGAVLMAFLVLGHAFSRRTTLGEGLQIVPFLFFFTALMIGALLVGDRRSVLRWSAPLRFLGYISYGLYLLHTLVYYAYDWAVLKLGVASPTLTVGALATRFACVLVVSVGVCTLSRRYFEEKFLRLKSKWAPY